MNVSAPSRSDGSDDRLFGSRTSWACVTAPLSPDRSVVNTHDPLIGLYTFHHLHSVIGSERGNHIRRQPKPLPPLHGTASSFEDTSPVTHSTKDPTSTNLWMTGRLCPTTTTLLPPPSSLNSALHPRRRNRFRVALKPRLRRTVYFPRMTSRCVSHLRRYGHRMSET